MNKLILFDIDGTLINSHGMGKRGFEITLQKWFGRHIEMSGVDWFGRTDEEILTEIMTAEGFSVTDIRNALPRIYGEYVILFRDFARHHRDQFELLPGVLPLLETLNTMDEIRLGLVTGNLMEAAFIKLEMADIDGYFRKELGGYGDDHSKRSELVRLAVERCAAHYGDFDDIFVVGDSHRDITAAKENGLKAIAVATGKLNECELTTYQPHHVFKNFSDPDHFLTVL